MDIINFLVDNALVILAFMALIQHNLIVNLEDDVRDLEAVVIDLLNRKEKQ